jgi:hypothetical protein
MLGKSYKTNVSAGIFVHKVAQHGFTTLQRLARHARGRVH